MTKYREHQTYNNEFAKAEIDVALSKSSAAPVNTGSKSPKKNIKVSRDLVRIASDNNLLNELSYWYLWKHRFASGCIFKSGSKFTYTNAAKKLRTSPQKLREVLPKLIELGLCEIHNGNLVFKAHDKVCDLFGANRCMNTKLTHNDTQNDVLKQLRKLLFLNKVKQIQTTIEAKHLLGDSSISPDGKRKPSRMSIKKAQKVRDSYREKDKDREAINWHLCAADTEVRCSITQWASIFNCTRPHAWRIVRAFEREGLVTIGGGELIRYDIPNGARHYYTHLWGGNERAVFTRTMLTYRVN